MALALPVAACSVTFDPAKLSSGSTGTTQAAKPTPAKKVAAVRQSAPRTYAQQPGYRTQQAYQPAMGYAPTAAYQAPPAYAQPPQAFNRQPSYVAAPIAPPNPQVDFVVVQPGDTLSGIAQQAGTTPEALMYVNRLTSTQIMAGQRLYIP